MENNILRNQLNGEWIEFDVSKIKNAKVLWRDATSFHDVGSINKQDEFFLDTFSYAVHDTPCFKDISFDINRKQRFLAERYGGAGIGVNGGGGRCGNYEEYQLKGVGINCMVGDHDDKEHGYGGLDARKAIVEIIYTYVLGKLLPLGTVKIHGLILVSETSGFNGIKPCWGVIMVRDNCIRPAHFMRAPLFKPMPRYKNILMGDIARVRMLNKRLASSFENQNQFIMLMGKFLQNAANQFAFARVARITHGTLSPSNISFDGRWLDLPVASFLSGGVNYNIWSQFYTEHKSVLGYALEIVHGYSKYNKITLNPIPLVSYYNEQFDAYFRHYIGFVLGFNLELVKQFESDDWKLITDLFNRVIHSGKHIEMRRPMPDKNDPVHALIVASFLSLNNAKDAVALFKLAKISESEYLTYSACFFRIMTCYEKLHIQKICKDDIVVVAALTAFKRSYLSAAFYLPAVDTQVVSLCNEKTPDDVAELINRYRDTADWIFEDSTLDICLYKSNEVRISYSAERHNYDIVFLGQVPCSFNRYSDLFLVVDSFNPEVFESNGFNFKTFFEALKNIIPLLESCFVVEGVEHV